MSQMESKWSQHRVRIESKGEELESNGVENESNGVKMESKWSQNGVLQNVASENMRFST